MDAGRGKRQEGLERGLAACYSWDLGLRWALDQVRFWAGDDSLAGKQASSPGSVCIVVAMFPQFLFHFNGNSMAFCQSLD